MTARLVVLGTLGATLLMTAGCTPRPQDILEEPGLGANKAVVLGSASRSINSIEIREDSPLGQVRPRRIVCAEPSPDVATTIAQSITASFNAAAQMNNPQGQSIAAQAAGQFGQSSVQGAIQLGERLATVTLLRDSLHRACEAYANGALTDMSYSLILSRYHATMVTLLNSELTAGAFGRELGALSGEAAHALGGLSDDIQAAQRSLETAQNEVMAQLAEKNRADAKLAELVAKKPADDAAAEQLKKEIEAQKTEVAKQNKGLADAKNREFLAKAEVDSARLRGASGRARIEAVNVKGIDANVTGETGDKLLALTKQFNESGVPEALLVACIASMDRRDQHGVLAKTCEVYLAKVNEGIGKVVEAKVAIAADKSLEAQRLTNDYQLRLAQIRASVVGGISRLCSSQTTADGVRTCIEDVRKVTTSLAASSTTQIDGASVAESAGVGPAKSIAVVPLSPPANSGVAGSRTVPSLPKAN
ncbi:MAG: hypothetical protein IT563_13415 [Alphaproteobacteria bacterium]|nr:hypothetical protein [Alphaproteobacteria bacterium]